MARFFENKMILFLTALGVRLLAGWWLGHFSHPATWEPEIVANNLLAGKGFLCDEHLGIPYRAYLLPAYPLFCAGVYLLTHHSQTLLLLLQCLLSSAACHQVHRIGRLVFPNPAVAKWGAWLTAFHPGLIYYATLLHPLTLDLFSYLWVLWACLALFKEPTAWKAIPLGLAGGLALLSRGTILPFLLLAGGLLLLRAARRHAPKHAIPATAIAFTVAMLAILPWLLRNAVVFGRFPVFITSGSQSFWQGNNPLSVGTAHLPDGRPIIGQLPADLKTALEQADEIGQSDLFQREAGAFIRRDPWAAIRLFLRKGVLFWWFSPTTGLYYPSVYTAWYRLYQGIILGLAGLGFWSLRRRIFSLPWALPALFLLSVACFQSFYYVEGRHRWTVEPVLLLFSACGGLSLAALSGSSAKNRSAQARQRTAQSYSVLWKQAFGRPLGGETASYHLEEILESVDLPLPKGRVLDAGCGDGIDLANQGRRPGMEIIGVELSDGGCWASHQRVRHLPAVQVIQADLCKLPFTDAAFDFVYSYGVLHHLASPASGLRELIRAARPGAWVAAYLYEDFNDRNLLWRIGLGLANLPRRLTTRMPHRLLYFLCRLISPAVFLFFTLPFRGSRRVPFLRAWTGRMPFRHASHPGDLAGDLYDRFATPIERRYSGESAEAFFRGGGLQQIRLANRRGWVVAGMKPSEASPCGS